MMIPYVEILRWNADKTELEAFSLIEPSQCWFELSYYETGESEVYAQANAKTINALKKGNFVRIPNRPFLWEIKSIQYEYNADGARMVDAKGFEAKIIAGQRIIRDPLQLPTSLWNAMELIYSSNLGTKAIPQRRIQGLAWDFSPLRFKETDAQATRGNLLDFTQKLLKLHKSGMVALLDRDMVLLQTIVGEDKSDSVLFAQSMDNLINATYFTSEAETKTHCQIVSTFNESEGTGTARTSVSHEYIAYYPAENQGVTGIDRMEMLLESNLSTKVTDEDGTEIEIDPSSATYRAMQEAEGASALAEKIDVTEFDGEIDLQNSQYEFEKDFFLGDLVMVRDEYFGYQAKARIVKYTFKQDENGYGEEAEYGNE